MNYITHLIECSCILPLYSKSEKPIYHKFPVFSTLNEKEELEEKYVACNNCDVIHKVTDFCSSEVMTDTSNYRGLVTTKEDLEHSLNDKIISVLIKNDCEVDVWEKLDFLFENNISDHVVISKKYEESSVICQIIYIESDGSYKIKREIFQRNL